MQPPNRDVIKAIHDWDGTGCVIAHMEPQPAGRVLNESKTTCHGIRIEMKNMPVGRMRESYGD